MNNKHVGFLVAGVLLITNTSIRTVDEHHPAAASQPNAAIPAETAPIMANSANTEKRSEQAHQQIGKMQARTDKIHQTKDPKGRQHLMAEHMQVMQDTMQIMHGMGGPIMVDIMGGQGMGAGGAAPVMGGSGMLVKRHMNMIGNRMDVMQVMMGQMLKQQGPSKKP